MNGPQDPEFNVLYIDQESLLIIAKCNTFVTSKVMEL